MDPMSYERPIRFPGIFILLMVLLSFGTVRAQDQGQSRAGRALMARKIDEPVQGDVDAAVELKMNDFNSTLSMAPSSWAIVEFFAHWCPACRNYKAFNGPNAAHPGIVFMTKVDCALKVNTKLCDRFSVSHYPLLLWGPPSKFAFGGWEPNADSGIEPIDNARTAESLLNWINKKISKSYSLDDEKFENELPANASDPVEVARSIYDIEEATANIFEIFVENKAINSDARVSFIRFLQIVAVHHPSKKIFCRGSKNETRGFSCGLWLLFHSLSVRIEDGESMSTFTAICDLVHNFFICEECQQHFSEMCSRVREPMKSRNEFVLWLWRAHNEVNQRLMVEEASLGTGDPKFPKMIWPPKQLCASCWISSKKYNSTHVDVNWNNTAVYHFLLDFYGRNIKFPLSDKDQTANSKQQPNLGEDITPSNAVAVPIGAAVAIAIASCGFGAVACFWRMQQKKRKHPNQFHTFKHI